MPNAEMKTLTIGDTTYEIVDEEARESVGDLSDLSTQVKTDLVSAINEVAVTAGQVDSVNGKTGAVVLTGSDINVGTSDSTKLSTKVSALESDITAETNARTAAVTAEANARSAADAQLQGQITALGNGAPIPVETIAAMTVQTSVYLYTGTETGESPGYWYTYDSAQAKFVPRGEYGAGVIIDNTLTLPNAAAGAEAAGQALDDLKNAFNAHFQSVDIITSIISGNFKGSDLTISNAAGGSIVCFPVVSGKKYTIVKPNTTGYWRIGYSEAIPAIGTTLTNYDSSASVSSLYATYTAPISGYIAALVSNDASNKAAFDSGVYAYEGEYNESYDIYTATLINTNVPVNINERLNQTDMDIFALEAKDGYLENKISFAYTDNDVINSNIRDCKVQITSDSVKKVVINFPNNATTYLYVITYDANDTQLQKNTCAYSVFYDADSKLLLVKTSDYLIRMIIDLDFVSENHPAYTGVFGSPAFGNSKLFDEQNYPYDRHITDFAPNSSGDPLSNYMKVRDAIKEIYLNSGAITTVSITNGKYLVLKNGSTNIATKEFGENYIGTILVDDYCGIYIDTTNIYGISLGNIAIAKTTSADNPMMSSRHVFYCGENREIKTLKAGVEAAEQYMYSTLYVDAGEYDLIDEFGDDYFSSLTGENQQAGLKLYNGIHIIFSSNSIVTAHYTGDNENVCTCFSPFNNGPYGFTLENLTLYSSRTRYGVHDVGGSTHNTTKYINCHIEQDNSNNQYWPQSCAIGAGLGMNQETEVSNCVFKGQVYWHLSSGESSDFRGRVQCINNYFINNTVQVSASRSDAENNTEFVITGNSFVPVAASDADGIVRTFVENASAVVYAWNNNIRSN